MSDYEALKRFGFSPAKAAEIILDERRGDTYAFMWLQLARGKMEAFHEAGDITKEAWDSLAPSSAERK